MSSKLVRIWGALALAIAPVSSISAAIPVQVRGATAAEVTEQADGSAIHRASSFQFPKEAGPLWLGKLVVYGPGDASGTYYLSGRPNDTLLSFFIYPASQSLDAEEKAVIHSIEQAWAATRIDAPVGLALPSAVRSGWYDLKNDQSSGRSVYVLARRGDWFIKARLTLAEDAGDEGLEVAKSALSELPWSDPESNSSSPQAAISPVQSSLK